MWSLETIIQLNAEAKYHANHVEAARSCGIRVLGNAAPPDPSSEGVGPDRRRPIYAFGVTKRLLMADFE